MIKNIKPKTQELLQIPSNINKKNCSTHYSKTAKDKEKIPKSSQRRKDWLASKKKNPQLDWQCSS